MSYEAQKARARLAERARERARLPATATRCSCPPDTYSSDGNAVFTPSETCPGHGVSRVFMFKHREHRAVTTVTARTATGAWQILDADTGNDTDWYLLGECAA